METLRIVDLRSHPGRTLVVYGTPIAFAITGMLHIVAGGDTTDDFAAIKDDATVWIGIHLVQLVLIPLLAIAVYWLTEGLTGPAARVSRGLLVPYVVFYTAYDTVVGLSNGLVVHHGSGLGSDEQAVMPGISSALTGSWDQPIPWMIVIIGSLSWAGAVVAAAVTLRGAGAPRAATVALTLAGVVGAVDHALPFGPIAMGLFVYAVHARSHAWAAVHR